MRLASVSIVMDYSVRCGMVERLYIGEAQIIQCNWCEGYFCILTGSRFFLISRSRIWAGVSGLPCSSRTGVHSASISSRWSYNHSASSASVLNLGLFVIFVSFSTMLSPLDSGHHGPSKRRRVHGRAPDRLFSSEVHRIPAAFSSRSKRT
jgi:hypothetical protein